MKNAFASNRGVMVNLKATRPTPRDVFMQLASQDSGTLGQWAKWDGNQYWSNPEGTLALAFRILRGVALVVTNPVGSPKSFDAALDEFRTFCTSRGLTPAFYCVSGQTQSHLSSVGWKTIEVGKEAVIHTDAFATHTATKRILRHASSRAVRHNCAAILTSWSQMTSAQKDQVRAILHERASQRRLPNIGFTVGTEAAFHSEDVDLALAVDATGKIFAVTSWHAVRRHGQIVGRTLETISRSQDSFNGVLDFLIGDAIDQFKNQGVEVVSLSGIPLLRSEPISPGVRERIKAKAVQAAKSRLEPFYGFEGLRRFKQKFGPELHSLYLVYPHRRDFFKVVSALYWAYFVDTAQATASHAADRHATSTRKEPIQLNTEVPPPTLAAGLEVA